jgi:transcriptional regulator NrdR family protein
MLCPCCSHTDSRVIRTDAEEHAIRRRRECARCRHRWNSTEIPEARAQLLTSLLAKLQPVRELLP